VEGLLTASTILKRKRGGGCRYQVPSDQRNQEGENYNMKPKRFEATRTVGRKAAVDRGGEGVSETRAGVRQHTEKDRLEGLRRKKRGKEFITKRTQYRRWRGQGNVLAGKKDYHAPESPAGGK